jgi:hypothetical protein
VVEFGPYEKFQEGGRGQQMYYSQAKHMLPVKTLRTIMKDLGHTYIDMVKLDIEGELGLTASVAGSSPVC